jgi:hypothetical protein
VKNALSLEYLASLPETGLNLSSELCKVLFHAGYHVYGVQFGFFTIDVYTPVGVL